MGRLGGGAIGLGVANFEAVLPVLIRQPKSLGWKSLLTRRTPGRWIPARGPGWRNEGFRRGAILTMRGDEVAHLHRYLAEFDFRYSCCTALRFQTANAAMCWSHSRQAPDLSVDWWSQLRL